MPEEQDVHADHDGYQREHVKPDASVSSHRSILLSRVAAHAIHEVTVSDEWDQAVSDQRDAAGGLPLS